MSIIKNSDSLDVQLVEAFNELGFRLLRILAGKECDNLFLSPYSIGLALAMTYNGAEGAPSKALAANLGAGEVNIEAFNKANATLRGKFDLVSPDVELCIANSIWVRQNNSLSDDFVKLISDYYDGKVSNLDVDPKVATDQINGWVANKTINKIKRLVTPEMLRRVILALVNAVYFKGTWSNTFDKEFTWPGPFYCSGGRIETFSMMQQIGVYDYFENDSFQAVRLPYSNKRFGMYIFLPSTDMPIQEFRENLFGENWVDSIPKFESREGTVVLPRFKLEYSKDIFRDLVTLVGKELESEDFLGMGAGPLVVRNVIHKTFLEVNEEGTEAAAATAVIMLRGASNVAQPFLMVIDRPFFLAIRDDETELLIFMGFVMEPEKNSSN